MEGTPKDGSIETTAYCKHCDMPIKLVPVGVRKPGQPAWIHYEEINEDECNPRFLTSRN